MLHKSASAFVFSFLVVGSWNLLSAEFVDTPSQQSIQIVWTSHRIILSLDIQQLTRAGKKTETRQRPDPWANDLPLPTPRPPPFQKTQKQIGYSTTRSRSDEWLLCVPPSPCRKTKTVGDGSSSSDERVVAVCAVVLPVMGGCCVCSSSTSDERVVAVCAVVLPVMSGCCVCSSSTSDEWLLCVQ